MIRYKEPSDLIGWNIASFRLEKIKAQDLIYDIAGIITVYLFTAAAAASKDDTINSSSKKTAGGYHAFSRTPLIKRVVCTTRHVKTHLPTAQNMNLGPSEPGNRGGGDSIAPQSFTDQLILF